MNKPHAQTRSEFLKRELEHMLEGMTKLELLDMLCVVCYLRWRNDHKIKHVFLAPFGWVLYHSVVPNDKGK